MKKPYLIHITDDKGNYKQEIADGIVELKTTLKNYHVKFGNYVLTEIYGARSEKFRNALGWEIEVECLVTPKKQLIDGLYYITIKQYQTRYNVCRKTIYNAINDGRLQTIQLGYTRLVENKEI